MEAGAISGTGGLLRPHLKPTPGGPQGFTRLNDLHPGGVAQSRSTWRRLERIQDLNLMHAGRTLDGPSTTSQEDLVRPPRVARLEVDM